MNHNNNWKHYWYPEYVQLLTVIIIIDTRTSLYSTDIECFTHVSRLSIRVMTFINFVEFVIFVWHVIGFVASPNMHTGPFYCPLSYLACIVECCNHSLTWLVQILPAILRCDWSNGKYVDDIFFIAVYSYFFYLVKTVRMSSFFNIYWNEPHLPIEH